MLGYAVRRSEVLFGRRILASRTSRKEQQNTLWARLGDVTEKCGGGRPLAGLPCISPCGEHSHHRQATGWGFCLHARGIAARSEMGVRSIVKGRHIRMRWLQYKGVRGEELILRCIDSRCSRSGNT